MDIVRRAYNRIADETAYDQDTWDLKRRVRAEVIRLIKERAYSGRDWPREWGTMPDELKSKNR